VDMKLQKDLEEHVEVGEREESRNAKEIIIIDCD